MTGKTSPWTRLGTAALTALISAMLGTAAFAQFDGPPPPFGGPPGGGMGRGMRGPRPSTAANSPLTALAAGLKLTAAQQAKIAKIQAQFIQQRRDLLPPPDGPPPDPRDVGAAMDNMHGLNRIADARIQAVLTPAQKSALPTLLKTLDDLRRVGISPATYSALKLTASQTSRITALARPYGGFGSALLTPAQRAIVDRYKAANPRPPFGGPGGFGPPHGGFGPPPPGEQTSQEEDHGRPVALVARDLGVTPEQFRAAFRKVHPAGAGQEPTEGQREANRAVLAGSLGVSPERLDAVMDKYRPGGRGTNGPATFLAGWPAAGR